MFVSLDKFLLVKMFDTGFFSLPTGNLYRKREKKKVERFSCRLCG